MKSLLESINAPADLRSLKVPELRRLAEELRTRIIGTVSHTGGHLAANLGVVELTLALLHTFDPPSDKILWDVGHQTYAWKLLTGRNARFDSLRQPGGISGFQRRSESPYDAFGAGHAGTAISAALGMAAARDRRGARDHVVAVVGDAGLCNGISLEALNNVAGTARRLIVVLNDNEMSISGNVGALSRYFGRLLANRRYNDLKGRIERTAQRLRMSPLRRIYHRTEEALKSLFVRSVLFEEFGLRYIGPIDGHNLPVLLDALAIARDYDRPILLHVATQKGRGFHAAEVAPDLWHGVGRFDPCKGELLEARPGYSQAFGQALEQLAERDERVVAITAAMATGTGLAGFARRFPDRFFDVGICEEHAVVFAAGLAAEGLRPVVALYSTFMQRAVDCVMHDVCLQDLPVTFCLDRAGVVGSDGPTHHGIYDIAMLRCLPGLTIMQPADEADLGNMLALALQHAGPCVIRYPREPGPGVPLPATLVPVTHGAAQAVMPATSPPVWFWALGDMLPLAMAAAARVKAAGIAAGVVNARFAKPLDTRLLTAQAAAARLFVTLENGVAAGGFGSALQEALAERDLATPVLRFGWPDRFIDQGTTEGLRAACGLTAEIIAERVLERVTGP